MERNEIGGLPQTSLYFYYFETNEASFVRSRC
jgi:hypothetical protein